MKIRMKLILLTFSAKACAHSFHDYGTRRPTTP